VAAIVVALEIGGRSFAAQIAVDALIIDVEFACYVFGVFVRGIGHSFSPVKVKGNGRKKCSGCNSICQLTSLRATTRGGLAR
jgi:hypothetical protein